QLMLPAFPTRRSSDLLDQAIGLSNALARALSGAARVLDGVRRGSGLLLPSEQEADRRAQAEALRAQIARLEAESQGDSLRSQPRDRKSTRLNSSHVKI